MSGFIGILHASTRRASRSRPSVNAEEYSKTVVVSIETLLPCGQECLVPGLVVDPAGIEPAIVDVNSTEVTITSTGPCDPG